jgi:DNA-binding IclR family transcriptional regulator
MVQVIDRVGALLRAFSDTEPELTLGECAERSGLTKSSAHRLLASLEEIGLVERLGNASWRLGGFVLRLAAVRLSQVDLRAEVIGQLRALGQRFLAATAFSVPHNTDMIYIERTDSPLPFAPGASLGSTAPMWAGAAGRAVLCAMDPADQAAHLSSPAWDTLPQAVRDNVLQDIEDASLRGYSIDRGQFFEGVAGVAVPVGRRHRPVAAFSLILSPDRMTPVLTAEMGDALIDLARRAGSASSLPLAERPVDDGQLRAVGHAHTAQGHSERK